VLALDGGAAVLTGSSATGVGSSLYFTPAPRLKSLGTMAASESGGVGPWSMREWSIF
jgi:hypothetical protein